MRKIIELKNLTVGYSVENPLIINFNYRFKAQIYGILGESGKGKTTLLRTIAGLNNPLAGRIIKPPNTSIYMMHQHYSCFEWLTALENILISSKAKKEKITNEVQDKAMDALKRVGLEEFFDYYPHELSGGMRQRLALARTMFSEPQVILMDEPLSALDPITRREMQDLVVAEHRKTENTVLMVTHDPEEAKRMCDEIIRF